MNLVDVIVKLNELTAINQRLGIIHEDRSISDSIAIIKKSIEYIKEVNDAIKDDFPKMITRLEKVKISNEKNINSVYTFQHVSFVWTPTNNILNITATIKGLTLVSPTQFNISSSSTFGANNIISTIINKGTVEQFTITSTDASLARVSVTWYVEFVA